MMRRDSLSALPVPQKVGDGQSDVCVYMGGGGPKGALQHSQHCRCEAVGPNCRSRGFSGIH